MQYERIKSPVQAIQLVRPIINPVDGNVVVNAGSWLVIDGNVQEFFTDEAFKREFRQVGTITTEETWLKGNPCTLLEVRRYINAPEPYRVDVKVCQKAGVASESWA